MKRLISILIISLVGNCSAFVDVEEPVIIFVGKNNPIVKDKLAVTIYPDIYICRSCIEISHYSLEQIIHHEMVHWKAQKNDPMWLTKYAVDKKFAFNEEIKAFSSQINYTISNEEVLLWRMIDRITDSIFYNYKFGYSKKHIKNSILNNIQFAFLWKSQ